MKNRSKSYTRHQRERAIQKKIGIVRNVFNGDDNGVKYTPVRGKFNKGKVHCSCWMCRYEQHLGVPKAKYQAKWHAMKKEIDLELTVDMGDN
ncbi:hypothetical protein NSQ95_02675 [Psychrobacillus sp. FSL W7-1457]|uniref:hypothetical protein n=1 Tax=Psychrobacillus sp. FSL W7-1457 TaxID=2954547 RepID=UPI00315A617A